MDTNLKILKMLIVIWFQMSSTRLRGRDYKLCKKPCRLNNTIQYSIQYSTVQYSTIQYIG